MASLTRTIFVAFLAVVAVGCGSAERSRAPLPDVEVVPLAGGPSVALSELGRPAVINLWATSCAPCRMEIPAFEQVHQERGDSIEFVGLNIGESADQAAPFIAEVGATYSQYLDELGYATTALEASAMPTTIVVDAEGNIATRHIGQMSVDDLNAAIDEALAG